MEKEEFLKLLPKLIKEDDRVKGAIITALSGVVATKDDIARLIEHSDRRFEQIDKRFEAMDKRFEAMQEQLDKRFEALQEQLDKRFDAARNEREDIKTSAVVIRETIGEMIQKMATKKDIEEANKEILDFLREQFKQE